MIPKEIANLLNKQIAIEADSSQLYLAMAVWLDTRGFQGSAKFMYAQTAEERDHMMKIMKYLLEVGETPVVPGIEAPKLELNSFRQVFENALAHEKKVTQSIHNIINKTVELKDHATYSFLQWFVNEQVEEENQFKIILDKLNMVGEDGRTLYFLDKQLGQREK